MSPSSSSACRRRLATIRCRRPPDPALFGGTRRFLGILGEKHSGVMAEGHGEPKHPAMPEAEGKPLSRRKSERRCRQLPPFLQAVATAQPTGCNEIFFARR